MIPALFAVCFALFASPIVMATPTSGVYYGDHSIQFIGVTGPEDGLCTWEYYVCSGESPAISHWIIESCVGTTNEDIECWTEPDIGCQTEYGEDPSTGITGLKFDTGLDDGQCVSFFFEVKECSAEYKEVGLKAGTDVYTGSEIMGPKHDTTAPEFAFFALPIILVGLVLGFSYRSATKRYM